MNNSDSNPPTVPSTPGREKRVSGSNTKSPHKHTTFSPPKKKTVSASNDCRTIDFNPYPDYFDNPPDNITNNESHADCDDAFLSGLGSSPLKPGENHAPTEDDYDVLADIGFVDAPIPVQPHEMMEHDNMSLHELLLTLGLSSSSVKQESVPMPLLHRGRSHHCHRFNSTATGFRWTSTYKCTSLICWWWWHS